MVYENLVPNVKSICKDYCSSASQTSPKLDLQHYNSEIQKFDSPALVHSRILMVILLVFFNSFYGPKERK